MQDKKLDDPSNQETKETSLVCMIGDIPNEATAVDNKNDPKIMHQQTDNGTSSITNLSKTEQKVDAKSTEKSGKTSKPYPKGTVYILSDSDLLAPVFKLIYRPLGQINM